MSSATTLPVAPKPKGGARPGAGRPPGIFKLNEDEKTLTELEGLAKLQCTTKEGAAFFKVAELTFIEFLKRSKKAREIWDQGREHGKASLRRMQIRAAEAGNATMLIWLGKQYLSQSDKIDNTFKGDADNPIVTRIELVAPGHEED